MASARGAQRQRCLCRQRTLRAVAVLYDQPMVSKPGQGRRFDLDIALDAAMRRFWRHGYDGVGVAALADAMGISVSSLYAAFGSKQALFEATLAYYGTHFGNFAQSAMSTSVSARDFGRRILHLAAEDFTRKDLPKGCYVISSSASLSAEATYVSQALSHLRNENIDAIGEYIRGRFPDDLEAAGVDAETVSRFICAVLQGMSQQSMDGASRGQLEHIASTAASAIDSVFRDR